jgi:hypothetical protein
MRRFTRDTGRFLHTIAVTVAAHGAGAVLTGQIFPEKFGRGLPAVAVGFQVVPDRVGVFSQLVGGGDFGHGFVVVRVGFVREFVLRGGLGGSHDGGECDVWRSSHGDDRCYGPAPSWMRLLRSNAWVDEVAMVQFQL